MTMHLFGDATQKPQSRCFLVPPPPLRPFKRTPLTEQMSEIRTGSSARREPTFLFSPISFSTWGGEARAQGLAARRFLPTHHTPSKHTHNTHWTQWALDVARLLGDGEPCGKEKRLRRTGTVGDTFQATDSRRIR